LVRELSLDADGRSNATSQVRVNDAPSMQGAAEFEIAAGVDLKGEQISAF